MVHVILKKYLYILVHVLILQNFSDIVAYFKKKCFKSIKFIFSTIRVKKSFRKHKYSCFDTIVIYCSRKLKQKP